MMIINDLCVMKWEISTVKYITVSDCVTLLSRQE